MQVGLVEGVGPVSRALSSLALLGGAQAVATKLARVLLSVTSNGGGGDMGGVSKGSPSAWRGIGHAAVARQHTYPR